MRIINIEHPEDVKALLDRELGKDTGGHFPLYSEGGWSAAHWTSGRDYVDGKGATASELLSDLRAKLEANESGLVEKLRKQAEAHGYALMKMPED